MTAIEILSSAPWSKPKNVPTRRGPKSVRNTPGTPELLALFETDRDALAGAGFSVGEYKAEVTIAWWSDPVAIKPRKAREKDPLSKSNVKNLLKKHGPTGPLRGFLSGRSAEETRAIMDRGWNADLSGPKESTA